MIFSEIDNYMYRGLHFTHTSLADRVEICFFGETI